MGVDTVHTMFSCKPYQRTLNQRKEDRVSEGPQRTTTMRLTHSLSLLLVCVILLPRVQSFASWFVKEYCNRKLVEGEIIMNNEVLEDDSRSIKVFRNNQELQSSIDSYIPGEELIVTISDKAGGIQYVFETTPPAKFIGGGCENDVRIAPSTHAKLLMPTESTGDSIRVWGGWAAGHEAVKLIKDFILSPPEAADSVKINSTPGFIITNSSLSTYLFIYLFIHLFCRAKQEAKRSIPSKSHSATTNSPYHREEENNVRGNY